MSPVNNDDSSGVANSGAGRPLTRKEIRAQEKFLATQGHDIIPPQAFETGQEVPAAPEAPREAVDAAPEAPREPADAAPAQPRTAPTVHEDPVHANPVHPAAQHEEPVVEHPVHEEPVHQEPAQEEPVHGHPLHDGPVHEYAGGMSREETLRRADELQSGRRLQDGADFHPGYASHPDDDAHHAYDDEPGRDLIAGAAALPTTKGPSKKVRRRRRFLALVLTLAVFVVAIVVGAQVIKPLLGGDKMADYPGPGTGSVTITVPPGAGPRSVAADMEAQKVIANADSFVKQFAASGGSLSPGTFTLRKEMNNADAVAVLLNKDQDKVMYFALSAGLRIGESLQAISEGTGIPVADLKKLSDSPKQFGVPAKAKNLEGFLFPGEYRFPLGTSGKDILAKLVSTTLEELKAQGVTDPGKQYDALTVASIVQAEGGQAEYGDVAGAIYNRLKPNNTETNGLIQSDATVTYGLGIRSFQIDEDQKADKSNRYNTYANPGLPAGPIGSPGKRAIDAAAKPKKNDYLYWVTINLDTKETKFSKTLAEHNGYVAKYNAWCEANPGRCV
ncbi:endolytic transglycosylase MltG [uncultured Arthrobacter sp.]|uniref:endolytic transglycosylase MltG n=1 Tax=uncultured Arthrobacter sp. TaxID=114050 RepID=UPI0032173E12